MKHHQARSAVFALQGSQENLQFVATGLLRIKNEAIFRVVTNQKFSAPRTHPGLNCPIWWVAEKSLSVNDY